MFDKSYWPNYKIMYPNTELSAEVEKFLQQSDRKIRYAEIDLKIEHPIKSSEDSKDQVIQYKPAREDSYERLMESGLLFCSELPTPEECLMQKLKWDELNRCLSNLSQDEMLLVQNIFYQDMTEQTHAKALGISQAAIHKRKMKILAKLKKMLNLEIFGY